MKIIGHAGGLISWFLALLKVDPTTLIRVSQGRAEFASASLSENEHRMIPIGSICSTYYGYHRPWKMALFIFLILFWFNIPAGLTSLANNQAITFLGWLLGAIIAGGVARAYYYLNRTFTLSFIKHSGVISAIKFKRSVIENVDVNEE